MDAKRPKISFGRCGVKALFTFLSLFGVEVVGHEGLIIFDGIVKGLSASTGVLIKFCGQHRFTVAVTVRFRVEKIRSYVQLLEIKSFISQKNMDNGNLVYKFKLKLKE